MPWSHVIFKKTSIDNSYPMKWFYHIAEKIKLALALVIVFVLVIMTNMINKSHFSELQESFTSIYEDRLLVENYIYKISGFLENKKVLLDSSQVNRVGIYRINGAVNDSIRQLIVDYEKTKFTEAESMYFSRFKEAYNDLRQLEERYLAGTAYLKDPSELILDKYRLLSLNLDKLSEIQLSESRRMLENSMRIIDSSNMASRFEMAVLIVIGLIVQGLIFASRSLKPRVTQKSRLN
jgi:hypothetical protein